MNGIGRDFLKAKPLCSFLAIDLYKQINGRLSSFMDHHAVHLAH